jgi:hypothetical protein
METNLPELCRRVWKLEPKSRPGEFSLVSGPFRCAYDGKLYTNEEAESMIQAAALRWLLANVDNMLKMDTLPNMGYAVWVMKKKRYWEDEQEAWIAKNKDLTTCLLLAVERCQEYKESSK